MPTDADLMIRQTLADANARFTEAIWNQDRDALAALFTADIQLLPPHHPALAGREAVLAFWARAFADPSVRVRSRLETGEVIRLGDVAIEIGRATVTRVSGDAETVVDRGKYIVIWKHEEGDWRMHRDIFNSDLPAA